MLLILGSNLAYATPNSPWTFVERACKPDATCSHGNDACGAMLNAKSCGGQGRSSLLAKNKGLLVSSSIGQACMPGMAAPRNAKRDETAGGGLRSMETA